MDRELFTATTMPSPRSSGKKIVTSRLHPRPIATSATFFFLALILLFFVEVDLRSARSGVRTAPGASKTAPDIGFDLTTSYGTAAIRHQNGSFTNVGKVSGDEAIRR